MSNTRVLACQIDENLQKRMKDYVLKNGLTVKSYVTGLIKEDLEKHAIQENVSTNIEKKVEEKQQEDTKEQKVDAEAKVDNNKNIENVKENKVEEKSKEEVKKLPIQENKKEIAHHPPEMMSDTFYALFCFNKCVFSKSAQWT